MTQFFQRTLNRTSNIFSGMKSPVSMNATCDIPDTGSACSPFTVDCLNPTDVVCWSYIIQSHYQVSYFRYQDDKGQVSGWQGAEIPALKDSMCLWGVFCQWERCHPFVYDVWLSKRKQNQWHTLLFREILTKEVAFYFSTKTRPQPLLLFDNLWVFYPCRT